MVYPSQPYVGQLRSVQDCNGNWLCVCSNRWTSQVMSGPTLSVTWQRGEHRGPWWRVLVDPGYGNHQLQMAGVVYSSQRFLWSNLFVAYPFVVRYDHYGWVVTMAIMWMTSDDLFMKWINDHNINVNFGVNIPSITRASVWDLANLGCWKVFPSRLLGIWHRNSKLPEGFGRNYMWPGYTTLPGRLGMPNHRPATGRHFQAMWFSWLIIA